MDTRTDSDLLAGANASSRALARDVFVFNVLFWAASALGAWATAVLNHNVRDKVLDMSVTNGSGLLMCLFVAQISLSSRRTQFSRLILISSLLTILATFACAGISHFTTLTPPRMTPSQIWERDGRSVIWWANKFVGWLGLFLAICYYSFTRDRERRLAAARSDAFTAQMRALRYQINPHFLFNSLNSIAALISENEHAAAERMVIDLSNFFRATLTLDPFQMTTLQDELALQTLYLDIERTRFPDRLRVEVNLPEDLRTALTPSLILQPLVENAVKHGLAPSMEAVTIRISAERRGDHFVLRVENDVAAGAGARSKGMGVGLANVRNRLRALYEDAQGVEAGPSAKGGYIVALSMPLRYPQ